jgi:hypothetical protein
MRGRLVAWLARSHEPIVLVSLKPGPIAPVTACSSSERPWKPPLSWTHLPDHDGNEHTLDRNDRYYISLCRPRPWATELVGFLGPEDESSALIGYTPEGRVAGFVMVGTFEPGSWTIVHIGVVPKLRGRGYVDDLLAGVGCRGPRTAGCGRASGTLPCSMC